MMELLKAAGAVTVGFVVLAATYCLVGSWFWLKDKVDERWGCGGVAAYTLATLWLFLVLLVWAGGLAE